MRICSSRSSEWLENTRDELEGCDALESVHLNNLLDLILFWQLQAVFMFPYDLTLKVIEILASGETCRILADDTKCKWDECL